MVYKPTNITGGPHPACLTLECRRCSELSHMFAPLYWMVFAGDIHGFFSGHTLWLCQYIAIEMAINSGFSHK